MHQQKYSPCSPSVSTKEFLPSPMMHQHCQRENKLKHCIECLNLIFSFDSSTIWWQLWLLSTSTSGSHHSNLNHIWDKLVLANLRETCKKKNKETTENRSTPVDDRRDYFAHYHFLLVGPDMKFVKNFTRPDFQAKSFTPQKCVICNISSQINSVNASNINNFGIFWLLMS